MCMQGRVGLDGSYLTVACPRIRNCYTTPTNSRGRSAEGILVSDAEQQGYANWRQLQYEWDGAQEGWNDSTSQYFQSHYWEPLADGSRDFLNALEALLEALRQAERDTES